MMIVAYVYDNEPICGVHYFRYVLCRDTVDWNCNALRIPTVVSLLVCSVIEFGKLQDQAEDHQII